MSLITYVYQLCNEVIALELNGDVSIVSIFILHFFSLEMLKGSYKKISTKICKFQEKILHETSRQCLSKDS